MSDEEEEFVEGGNVAFASREESAPTAEIASRAVRSVISGKVAQVVSDREVILNRGSSDGVTAGMYFKVLDDTVVSVPDPDTGEDLGGFKRVKIVLQAAEVAPRITLARTFRTRRVNVGGTGSGGLALSQMVKAIEPPKYVEQVERLTLDPNAARQIRPEDSVVKTGDPFEEASETEVEDLRSISVWRP